jgi:predicted transcriptional regulator
MYDMKTSTITIRLDEDLNKLLNDVSRESGRSRSEIAREALRRQLSVSQFDILRKRSIPFAEARDFLTDEDVFNEVS